MTYELFFQKSSITACVCVVDHYHTRVEIQQMVQTHKKINKIHSVEIQSLTTDAFIHMKRTHHPLLTTPLSTFNLLGIIFTRMIPSSDRTRGCLIHVTQNIGIISNTSSQGELSYCVSSLHVAFTAQKVRLTILWCIAKWKLQAKRIYHTKTVWKPCLDVSKTRWTESGGVHNYAWEISPPASLLEKSKKDWITSGMRFMDQPCPTSVRRKTNLQ